MVVTILHLTTESYKYQLRTYTDINTCIKLVTLLFDVEIHSLADTQNSLKEGVASIEIIRSVQYEWNCLKSFNWPFPSMSPIVSFLRGIRSWRMFSRLVSASTLLISSSMYGSISKIREQCCTYTLLQSSTWNCLLDDLIVLLDAFN